MNAGAGPLRPEHARAVRDALAAHDLKQVEFPERRQAGVLIPLFERDAEPWVVLTMRTDIVATHKGQISFPGGAKDPGDDDLWQTALRETVEELGIDPASVEPLGRLDDYPTFSSGFVVSPFVGSMDPPARWDPNPHEIHEVIELPLRALVEVERTEVWDHDSIRFPMHVFEVGRHYVWGVTAFILHRFLEIAGPALGYQRLR